MLAFFLALAGTVPSPDVPATLEREVNAARAGAGVPHVERVRELDAVAATRAAEAAGLPEERRFEPKATAEELLRSAGIGDFLRAWVYLAWQGGYADDAPAAVANWRAYRPSWERALDPSWRRAGFATAKAADGTVVIVALFVEPSPELPGVEAIERSAFDALNREREVRGLPALAFDARLAAVARAHSRDMLERGYFSHRSPEGEGPAARVTAASIPYRLVAENIAQNVRVKDPTAEAVKQWMTSPGHRENVLAREFTRSAVGVAVDVDERRLVFTQLFLRPLEAAGDE
ncbi:MAG TPA: CAP domain-containing protein [Candidatus Polarisedimenticolaceae bacterium]